MDGPSKPVEGKPDAREMWLRGADGPDELGGCARSTKIDLVDGIAGCDTDQVADATGGLVKLHWIGLSLGEGPLPQDGPESVHATGGSHFRSDPADLIITSTDDGLDDSLDRKSVELSLPSQKLRLVLYDNDAAPVVVTSPEMRLKEVDRYLAKCCCQLLARGSIRQRCAQPFKLASRLGEHDLVQGVELSPHLCFIDACVFSQAGETQRAKP